MVKWLLRGFGLLLILTLFAIFVQQHTYQAIRQNKAMDRQAALYSPQAFHVATLLRLSNDQSVHEGIKDFVAIAQKLEAKPIYAGQVVTVARKSSQIDNIQWDAVVLFQYQSREAWDVASADAAYLTSIARFRTTYSFGFQRDVAKNILGPFIFQLRRLVEAINGRPRRGPFERKHLPEVHSEQNQARSDALSQLLDRHSSQGKNAIVVVNLMKKGTAKQEEANKKYGDEMMAVLAENGGGPMHIGKAITLQGTAKFDQVGLVYYPGIEFFFSLVRSKFFNSIVGGKQLGDDLAVPTVPILNHVLN